MRERYRQIFPAAILFSAGLIWIGFLLDEPGDTIAGLYRIVVSENILITDYVYIAGPGAALINSGIVTGISICILKFSGASFNGDTIVKMGLMSGFSLFGKISSISGRSFWAAGSMPSIVKGPFPDMPPWHCCQLP